MSNTVAKALVMHATWRARVTAFSRALDAHGLAMLLDRDAGVVMASRGTVYLDGGDSKQLAQRRRAALEMWAEMDVETQLRFAANVVDFVNEGRRPERWTA